DQGDQARIVYMVDGGDSGWNMGHQALHSFHRQIGLEEHPPNEWMEEKMWAPQFKGQPAFIVPAIANLTSGPSGLTYHPGTGFLKDEVGRFLICDYRGGTANSGIWSFKMDPSGAGMKMTDSRQFDWGASATDVEYSWDGKLYVADFMGGWSTHEDGRVYSVEAKDRYLAKESDEVAKLIAEGIEKKPTPLLAKLLTHPDMRVRLRAELALTRRTDGMEVLVRAATSKADLKTRLHGVWGLGIIARRGSAVLPAAGEGFVALAPKTLREEAKKTLLSLLNDQDAEVRAQVIKVIGESGLAMEGNALVKLIGDDSPRVRFFATIAAGKMKVASLLPQIWTMLEKNEDPYLRHAGAYAMALMAKPEQIIALKDYEDASVRMTAVVALRRLKDEGVAAFINDSEPEIVDEVIRAIHDESIEKSRWVVAEQLESEVKERPIMMWRRLLHSAFRLGDEENLKRVIDFVVQGKGSEAAQLEALRLLGEWAAPHQVDQSLGHLAPLPARDPKPIAAVLNTRLAELIKLKGKLLEPALALVNKYGLDLSSVSDADLKGLVTNENVPGLARGKALDLYAGRNPADIAALLQQLAGGKDDDLAIAALTRLAKSDPKSALAVLDKAVTGSAHRQQAAWGIAADLPEAGPLFAAQLKQLQDKSGVSPAALELVEAAGKRAEPEVKAALESYQKALAASTDPLAPFMGSLEGGDPKKGGELFESQPAAQCMRCHSGGGHGGGEAGPDLTGVCKRGDRRYLLESLIDPGAKVVAGFGLGSITLKGGKNVAGTVIEQTADHVDVDSSGKTLRVMKSDIESMIEPVSPMPPMGALLSGKEIRDIVAWLATRDQKSPEPKKRPAPEVVKP
ncbi:MAG: hypothetical protein JWO82_634, partial [Akkermansiaceae bacterium]|nr:hypothetical protein [Akkermansiaceae bacterium]